MTKPTTNPNESLAPGILAGMLEELAIGNPKHSEILLAAAKRLKQLPNYQMVPPIREELMRNGAPTDLIAELVQQNIQLRHLLNQQC